MPNEMHNITASHSDNVLQKALLNLSGAQTQLAVTDLLNISMYHWALNPS